MLFFLIPIETNEERWAWLLSHLGQKELNVLHQEAYSILGNHDDADDVLQASLLKGALRCHQLRDESKVFFWMLSIVRNEAHSHYKRFSLHTILTQSRLSITISPYVDSAEYTYFKSQEKSNLRKAISELKSPEKDIVIMKVYQGLSFPEIAEQLDMNYHTVRSQYQRTLKKLKKAMEGKNDD